MYLTNLGLAHYFSKEEIIDYLKDFSVVEPLEVNYFLPSFEAKKRGYSEYKQSMWTVFAVK